MKNRLTLPLLPLRGLTIFPGMSLHFDVGRPKSIAAVRQALEADKLIFLCYQNDITVDEPGYEDLATVGVIAEIKQLLNLPDGNIRILVDGLHRGSITRFTDAQQFVTVNVNKLQDIPFDETEDVYEQLSVRRLLHLVENFLDLYDRFNPEVLSSLLSIDDPGEMADIIAFNFPLKPQLKQEVLDAVDVEERICQLMDILEKETQLLKLEKEVMDKVQTNLDQNQRDYMLREKLHVVQEELGEDDTVDADIRKFQDELSSRTLPAVVTQKLEEEIERLGKTHPFSQEYGVIQNYIETVLALPWERKTEDTLDLAAAKKILDRDHCGLEKVKERILEYIAVRKLNGNPKSNILCLVGPPGVGKTSIAQSLATALGRKYTRISLGGVHNEAEIRGHRKTYVGAMPGRVIEALKYVESSNPLMLFDEIDKMANDYSGDPASAMLEVFDPEQNKTFRDHFVELPFDLSDVLLIATANTTENIPTPLLDRMDLIEVSGYTPEEKSEIAKKHLIPKQRSLHGLKPSQLKIAPSAISVLIESYTRESGVRSLERKIAAICRKVAVKIVNQEIETVSVTARNVETFLGKPIYHYEKTSATNEVGLVTGLAWTESGGDTLSVEVNTMPGTGKLELTGNLGDVMQESAKAALSFVRSNAFRFAFPQDFYKNTDIHIHVPEGAIPKDGPSAGITMATALVSALSGQPVNRHVAMTGEVTLRGRVLPIGGLKEKTLAAYRMGIKTVIIPYENRADYEELPENIKSGMDFVFAKEMPTVLAHALLPASKRENASKEIPYMDPLRTAKDLNNPQIRAHNNSKRR